MWSRCVPNIKKMVHINSFLRCFHGSRGCLKSWLLFRHPREFKIKSLYSNDLILNIASKSKETVQKLKFLDSPSPSANVHGCTFADDVSAPSLCKSAGRLFLIKRKMTGKEGAYPVYPLYNHPSKKNVIVCKTNLSVFLTNFSLSATPFQ